MPYLASFLTSFLATNSCRTLYRHSLVQLRFATLQIRLQTGTMLALSIRTEGWKAVVVQMIARIKFSSFLMPDTASKNDARHDIVLSTVGTTRCHVWHRFFFEAMFGFKKLSHFVPANQLHNLGFSPALELAK